MGRALMGKPKLLLLDEPSLGLAPMMVDELLAIARRIADAGTTVLMVEQNVKKALAVADRGYVIERGALVASGSAKLLARSTVIREAYLGAESSDTTTAAEHWTYADIIDFLFYWYVPSTVCTCTLATLTGPAVTCAGSSGLCHASVAGTHCSICGAAATSATSIFGVFTGSTPFIGFAGGGCATPSATRRSVPTGFSAVITAMIPSIRRTCGASASLG